MANTDDNTPCDRTKQRNSRPVTITNHFELFTALVGTPDEHQYKFPWDDNLLEAIDSYLKRQIFSNARAIRAIGQTFVEASVGYYRDDYSANQDEVFLCKETRDLMSHITDLAGQIEDNSEIRATLSIEVQRRQR